MLILYHFTDSGTERDFFLKYFVGETFDSNPPALFGDE
jgi:hypothetical protein